MKKTKWILWFSLAIFSVNAQSDNSALDQKMAKVLARMPEANIGVVFTNAQGTQIYGHKENQLFTPASTTKVFTSAAALAKLGADYRYPTTLAKSGADIYLITQGDPSFTSENLKTLLTTLKQQGITTITGNLVVDDTAFSGSRYAKGVEWQDVIWYYGAPVDSIILDRNQMNVNIKANELNQKASVSFPTWEKYRPELISNVNSVTYAQSYSECQLIIKPDLNNRIDFQGCWAEKNPVTLRLAVQHTRPYMRDTLLSMLKQLDIQLQGNVTFGKAPQNITVLQTYHSADLSTLVSRILKKSDNLYADSLLKNLAVESNRKGGFQTGVETVKSVLSGIGYTNASSLELYDGSGTSHYNLVTPLQLTKVLKLALDNKQTWGQPFIKGLPVCGVDGTLRYRFSDTALKGKVIAKTGGLTGVQTLAGYLVHNGTYYPFAIMMDNVPKAKRKQTNGVQAAILLTLLDEVKG